MGKAVGAINKIFSRDPAVGVSAGVTCRSGKARSGRQRLGVCEEEDFLKANIRTGRDTIKEPEAGG
jgi:hypothetical protein